MMNKLERNETAFQSILFLDAFTFTPKLTGRNIDAGRNKILKCERHVQHSQKVGQVSSETIKLNQFSLEEKGWVAT